MNKIEKIKNRTILICSKLFKFKNKEEDNSNKIRLKSKEIIEKKIERNKFGFPIIK